MKKVRKVTKDHELEAAVKRAVELNIPLSTVCRRAEVDQSTLWKWRTGRSSPTMSNRQAVLEAIHELCEEVANQ